MRHSRASYPCKDYNVRIHLHARMKMARSRPTEQGLIAQSIAQGKRRWDHPPLRSLAPPLACQASAIRRRLLRQLHSSVSHSLRQLRWQTAHVANEWPAGCARFSVSAYAGVWPSWIYGGCCSGAPGPTAVIGHSKLR